MQILVAYASLSGNTRDVARQLAARCQWHGHQVRLFDVDGDAAHALARPHDLLLLGSWTDNAGRTPAEMKRFVAAVRDHGGLPSAQRVAVFGTGETQWGLEYYCGAAHRLARFFSSPHAVLEIEQMPHGAADTLAIHSWADTVLAHIETLDHADPARRHA
ncbi:flavodoxin [Stenotrophomonas rhizophila]|uniref:flavodoxin n=1 Tax=Stenotrophomonas rhizophila TaxID=216778 RepID=UPI001E5F81C6|nr:flavodoxin [Stenotrophomonas rhizophila]MCC7633942.1 flavodoxin [Stenotrophomonas rhizophila]MCC7663276.1 flavodoxin [Stenotrophomonas rhizophila]